MGADGAGILIEDVARDRDWIVGGSAALGKVLEQVALVAPLPRRS